jgi:cytochrome c biogenesis protein CcmG/thiol:disulfide interchange protein DsbE
LPPGRRSSARWIVLAAAVALVCAGTWYARHHAASNDVKSAVQAQFDRSELISKPAPDFTLTDATGETVKLSDQKGKVVLLNFWATWCGPCKVEIPWFMNFQQQYKDRNFTVLGVAFDDDGWTAVKPYIAEHKINYRVVVGNDALDKAYGGVESLPTTFLIGRDGRVASKHVGLVSKSTYQEEIARLLQAPVATGSENLGLLHPPSVPRP